MDYLFNTEFLESDDSMCVDCLYIVDDKQKYILFNNSKSFILKGVFDNNSSGNPFASRGEADYFVICKEHPILTVSCRLDNERDFRTVKLQTYYDDPSLTVPKKSSNTQIIIRSNDSEKLF